MFKILKEIKIAQLCSLVQIQDIVRESHLLTIFRVREDSHGDVDVAILKALLKGNH